MSNIHTMLSEYYVQQQRLFVFVSAPLNNSKPFLSKRLSIPSAAYNVYVRTQKTLMQRTIALDNLRCLTNQKPEEIMMSTRLWVLCDLIQNNHGGLGMPLGAEALGFFLALWTAGAAKVLLESSRVIWFFKLI